MSNIEDYLQWRGDLTLEQSPFCEVDNLILSYLSYVKFNEVLPQNGETSMTIEELSKIFFEKYTDEELSKDKSFIRRAPYLLKGMANSRRFQNARVKNYINLILDSREMQFSAMEIELEDGTSYISYEGTDDTIVGWKEDFNLSNGRVEAQKAAAEYLNRVGGKSSGALRVGGHSKGGNLAIYGAAKCKPQIQEKIIEVYCNDGPGFTEDFLKEEGFLKIAPKVLRYIPEYSIIGMLLEHKIEPKILESSQKGVFQHDGFSWEVMGPGFVHKEELNGTAQVFDETLRKWIGDMDKEQRKAFIEDFFSVLEAPGVATLTELQNGGIGSIRAMLAQVDKLNPETKEGVLALLKGVAGHWSELMKTVKIEFPLLGKREN